MTGDADFFLILYFILFVIEDSFFLHENIY